MQSNSTENACWVSSVGFSNALFDSLRKLQARVVWLVRSFFSSLEWFPVFRFVLTGDWRFDFPGREKAIAGLGHFGDSTISRVQTQQIRGSALGLLTEQRPVGPDTRLGGVQLTVTRVVQPVRDDLVGQEQSLGSDSRLELLLLGRDALLVEVDLPVAHFVFPLLVADKVELVPAGE